MYKIGDRFTYRAENYTEDYILAQVDNFKLALISLQQGNRWTNPVVVEDPENITESEFRKIAGCSPHEGFERI